MRLWLTVLVVLAAPISAIAQAVTTRVSVGPAGVEANDNSSGSVISADGRWVAFASWADTLIPGDTNAAQDVFLHELQTGVTTRVSVDSGGAEANGSSHGPAISADGRFITFESMASNLVAGDTNGESDVFVHDRITGVTTRVSLQTGGAQGDFPSRGASISATGRWVLFSSDSALVAGDTNRESDVFLHDRKTGVTTRVSVGTGGAQANAPATAAAISADGRWVVFQSWASNLAPGDTNGANDVFLHDRQTGTTSCVSTLPGGWGTGNAPSYVGAISADGRWLAFSSAASNLTFDDTNNVSDVFVHDRTTGQNSRISLTPGGGQATGDSSSAFLSPDGRWVSFVSIAPNLVADDTNDAADVFVHDRQTGASARVSVATGGLQADGHSTGSSISADGRVTFASTATNLVAGDTNGRSDVFVFDRRDGLCGLAVAPAAALVPAAGTSGLLVVVTAASCGWAVTSSAPSWLMPTGSSAGAGPGKVTYAAAVNTGAPRGATLSIDGATFAVEQAGALTPERPESLHVYAVNGTRVTLYWTVPAGGPRPTGFVIEGGARPGEVLVSAPTGSAAPAVTFDAPVGSFYARVHAVNGTARSAASNEVRVHVEAPLPPSPPANLMAVVEGSTVSLTWTNTFAAGTPTSIVLEVSGTTTVRVLLGLVDHVAFSGVPAGTYRVAVRAMNAVGTSERSSTLVVTVPATCPGVPAVPVDVRAYREGRTAIVSWAPDMRGIAPTSYTLVVTGSTLAAVATAERSVSGTVGPGTYLLSVVAVNACGVSAGTPMQTLVVP